jgi:hypothetical protein
MKRGKGLFKLSIGDGRTKVSGLIKRSNTTKDVKSMEPCAMFCLGKKLYVRDYCSSPTPFKVFDCHTLELDQELSQKWKDHFEQVLKDIETPQ